MHDLFGAPGIFLIVAQHTRSDLLTQCWHQRAMHISTCLLVVLCSAVLDALQAVCLACRRMRVFLGVWLILILQIS